MKDLHKRRGRIIKPSSSFMLFFRVYNCRKWARLRAPVFSSSLVIIFFMPGMVTSSSLAICRSFMPLHSRSSTSCSRRVSGGLLAKRVRRELYRSLPGIRFFSVFRGAGWWREFVPSMAADGPNFRQTANTCHRAWHTAAPVVNR